MTRAIAQARDSLPRFFRSFRAKEFENYSVKLAVPTPRGPDREHIWMRLETVDDTTVTGRLTNEPVNLPGVRLNSRYSAPISIVSDWSYWRSGVRYGNYTTRVILDRIPAKDADAVRLTLSPTP